MDDRVSANKQIAYALFDALSRADSAAVAKLYADDFTLWSAGSLPFSGTSDRARALQAMDQILGLFPDGLRITVTGITAEGDRVAVEAESHGRHVSGQIYHNQYHFLLVIRGGKILQLKEYLDTEHARDVLLGGG